MFQRSDGIVDFDSSLCIGCKACMQACPYDAIYIDPDTHTAAKCHYCAHRTEIGLEPACVVVCPEQSIISGDIDNPQSQISQLLSAHEVKVRKPEQGTSPNLFYIEGDDVALRPTPSDHNPETFMWADVVTDHKVKDYRSGVRIAEHAHSPSNEGPIQVGGRIAEHMVQVAYNAQHKHAWHWQVPAYLVTKGIGSGLFMLYYLGLGLGWIPLDIYSSVVVNLVALLFMVFTSILLCLDLDRPERFLRVVLHPQWRSWLARGAYLLIGYSAVAGLAWVLEAGVYFALVPMEIAASARPVLLWIGLPLAASVAIYTAFLFAQAKGRELWQDPILPVHLLLQALIAGAAAMLVVDAGIGLGTGVSDMAVEVLLVLLLVDILVIFLGQGVKPRISVVAESALHEMKRGRYRKHFWYGGLVLGHVVPLLLLATGESVANVLAGVVVLIGLYLYEYAFVMAPQVVPNS